VQKKLGGIAGANAVAFQPPPLPGAGGGGLPVQFVIGTTESFTKLNEVTQVMMDKARESGMFMFLDTDLKIDKPQVTIDINRDKTAQLGLSMRDIGNALSFALGGNYINYFDFSGRSYKVIPQMMRGDRFNADQLLNYYVTTGSGTSIPLSTVVDLSQRTVPQSLNHFQQLNSATISGVPFPGVTLGQALQTLQELAKENLPENFEVDYTGEARQYMKESHTLALTFVFALIIIFLSLAALFESFRDPIIVLVSVPMSIFGAMIFISLGLGGVSLNIYTRFRSFLQLTQHKIDEVQAAFLYLREGLASILPRSRPTICFFD
ncbi:MAG: efflux RND transporter permease subunit, partial [Desulfitobacterium hafniense]|nr:efflux RND transporter permease subunit [Desulfitobacterium hafniense]